jgi:hypothetical protein
VVRARQTARRIAHPLILVEKWYRDCDPARDLPAYKRRKAKEQKGVGKVLKADSDHYIAKARQNLRAKRDQESRSASQRQPAQQKKVKAAGKGERDQEPEWIGAGRTLDRFVTDNCANQS